VGGVVAVKFGLLEGEQIVLFLEHGDAAGEAGFRDAGDEDAVEGFDEEGPVG